MRPRIVLSLILSLLLILPVLLLVKAKPDHTQAPIALTHVTVIDVTGGAARRDTTVVITGDRISAIGDSANTSVPADAKVVDATGKFLIPGLWDMHVHWYAKDTLGLFTANGVTGVRQMFGNPDLLRWRDEIAKGSLLGPRMVVASPIIDGPEPVWPNSISVRNEEEGRKAVRRVKQWGADFVKVYALLPRDAYFGIADEAKQQGMTLVGHVPFSVSPAEASDAGQKSIEHLTGILIDCSPKQTELRDELVKAKSPAARHRVQMTALETYDEKKAADLFARFVKNHTWQCPTLTVLRSSAYLGDQNFRRDGRLKYIPRQIQQRWSLRISNSDEGDHAGAKKILQKDLEIVGAMRKAGVPILAGTDTGNPFCFPGFSLHEELALLVIAGLTPVEALRSATLNPAEFFGLDKTLGTIAQGKIADLVLLDANPLQDIRNTQRINAVISNGRLFDRKALDKMLADAQGAANW
ncbi:MAG TPA: amidohydrolase family protein [Pyrinomonadaceae bacterium]|nr:amidohydrolase family protein [Pyrinomonadaceae bacterium]